MDRKEEPSTEDSSDNSHTNDDDDSSVNQEETMIDDYLPGEDRPIHIPLLQAIDNHNHSHSSSNHEEGSSSSVESFGNENARDKDNNGDNDDQGEKPSLPLALLLSYGLYGFSMSLPTLPMMYILNTRVPLPLSLLPTYGALAFMPYSLKPLYAFGSTYLNSRRTSLCLGWACCALATIGWTLVRTVPGVFVVGMANGTAMAWSGFLLGLTLLDTARANHDNFEVAASLFQSQAATARNIGSLSASVVTCLVFGMNRNSTDQSQWSEPLVDGLFGVTSLCHIFSFLLVVCGRQAFAPLMVLRASPSSSPETTTTTATSDETIPSRRSYAALEMYPGDDESLETTESDEPDDQPASLSSSPFCNPNFVVIVALQISILLVAMRQPIQKFLAVHDKIIPVAICLVALVCLLGSFCGRYGCTSNSLSRMAREVRSSFGWSHLVGLVLILRHAVPSTSAVLGSFIYHCFQAQPVWLQIFSLADTGMITLASWSYQKLWAPQYSHGRKLITFMAVMTVVSHSMSNIYILVVHYFNDEVSLDAKSMFPWMVLIIKVLSAFVSEWNFLPSVVLATVSVSETKATWNVVDSNTANEDTDANITTVSDNDLDEETQQVITAAAEKVKPIAVPTSASSNVMYGSLVSCIDFGDQLGSILSTPLVTALGITRENDWHNLDYLIEICSGIGILSAGIFLLLLWGLPDKHGNASRGESRP